MEFEAISTVHVREFLDSQSERGLSDRSINGIWIALSALWTWAALELETPHILRGHIPMPKFKQKVIVPFNNDEVKRLLRAAEWTMEWSTAFGKPTRSKRPTAGRDRAIILTLLDTGLRATELCKLEIRDYNSDEGRLFVREGKGDKERFVYMGERAQKAIWRYNLKRKTKPTDPLFATKTKNFLNRDNLRKTLQRIAQSAEVEDVYTHRFRHTFAITFLRNGGNVFELKRILGHEKLETVEIYLELAQVDIANAQRNHSPADNWRL
jgi:integrase/recombinase XerD